VPVPHRLIARCLSRAGQTCVTRQRNPVPFRERQKGLSGKTHAVGAPDADGDGTARPDRMLSNSMGRLRSADNSLSPAATGNRRRVRV